MVSTAGLTRSNGSVSHAGNRSTSSGPRKAPRSRASRSASPVVGIATTIGWRLGACGQAGDDDGPRRLGHGQHGVAAAEHGGEAGLVGEEGGESR